MPRTHLSRQLVSLAASAITAVYVAGYVHTESADSLLAASSSADVRDASAPTAPVPSVSVPPTPAPVATLMPTAVAITDQAVELYADQHHVSWDDARAQMEATAGLPMQVASSSPSDTPTPVTNGSTAASVPARAAPPQATPRPAIAAATLPSRPSPIDATPPRTPVAASAPTTTRANAADLKDGTYSGVGTSRRGNVQVSVLIQAGRIATVNITGATTEYPIRLIASLPAEVVSRQSAQVDLVSGATYSSQAFRSAVLQAMQRAQG